MLKIMLLCKHNAEQFIQLNGWPGSTQQAGIFADFMKVICNLHFIQLQITCNIVTEIQLQLLELKCNSITITITELVIQLHVFQLLNNTVHRFIHPSIHNSTKLQVNEASCIEPVH